MRSIAHLLAACAIWALPTLAAAAPGEERIEGIVRDTVVTHCDATRLGGCAGALTLRGKRVIVTQVDGGGARLARAIEVAERAHAEPAAGATSRDVC